MEYYILQPGCADFSGGWVADTSYSEDECDACLQPFGIHVPIVIDEGRMTQHLRCFLATHSTATHYRWRHYLDSRQEDAQ